MTYAAFVAGVEQDLAHLTRRMTFLWRLCRIGGACYSLAWIFNEPRDSLLMRVCVFAAYVDDSNTIGHITGYILTSLPLGRGGWSPYSVVPTCILQAGDHLFHDEVNPLVRFVLWGL